MLAGTARLYRGMSLAQTPPGLPLTRRSPRRALACRGQPPGVCLASQGPPGGAPLPPRAGMPGPHAIGAERFATVSSSASFAQVAGALLGKQARVQISDKDEAAGSSPARPTDQPLTSQDAGRSASRCQFNPCIQV